MILKFLQGQLWKIATGGALIAALLLSFGLLRAEIENRHLLKMAAMTEKRINDPKTGLVVRLAQAETNVATVRTALTRQNTVLKQQSAEDRAKLAAVSAQLLQTQRDNQRYIARVRLLMAPRPKGASPIDRYEDIDSRLLESLK